MVMDWTRRLIIAAQVAVVAVMAVAATVGYLHTDTRMVLVTAALTPLPLLLILAEVRLGYVSLAPPGADG